MVSTAKVLSSLPAQDGRAVRATTTGPGRSRWGWLELLREMIGGALLLAVWIALWTATWAAVAGPLAPVGEAGARTGAAVSSVERT